MNGNNTNLFTLNINDAIIVNSKDLNRIMEENSILTKEVQFYKKIYEMMKNTSSTFKEEIINSDELSFDETKKMLENELIKTKNEIAISELIYSLHDCDSYEDLFRDNIPLLQTRCNGIQIAIDNLTNKDDDDDNSEKLS
jgi:hypothetical protein